MIKISFWALCSVSLAVSGYAVKRDENMETGRPNYTVSQAFAINGPNKKSNAEFAQRLQFFQSGGQTTLPTTPKKAPPPIPPKPKTPPIVQTVAKDAPTTSTHPIPAPRASKGQTLPRTSKTLIITEKNRMNTVPRISLQSTRLDVKRPTITPRQSLHSQTLEPTRVLTESRDATQTIVQRALRFQSSSTVPLKYPAVHTPYLNASLPAGHSFSSVCAQDVPSQIQVNSHIQALRTSSDDALSDALNVLNQLKSELDNVSSRSSSSLEYCSGSTRSSLSTRSGMGEVEVSQAQQNTIVAQNNTGPLSRISGVPSCEKLISRATSPINSRPLESLSFFGPRPKSNETVKESLAQRGLLPKKKKRFWVPSCLRGSQDR